MLADRFFYSFRLSDQGRGYNKMIRYGVLIAMIAVLAMMTGACTQNKARVVSSPYRDGTHHSEPVFYNGKHYKLKFKYLAHQDLYDVNIIGKGGRYLGAKAGDEKIVSNVVSSAIRHFACARGKKAHIVPGTVRHSKGAWMMQARCGQS